MSSDQEISNYLSRISYDGGTDLTITTLKSLHLSHMYTVPFENLDITLGRKFTVSPHYVIDKIVLNQRGGFCYEVNYAFSLLLASLGFDVKLLAARVHDGGDFGKPFAHLLLLVNLHGKEILADVGFGDSFREPLFLNDEISKQCDTEYKIEKKGSEYTLLQCKDGYIWKPQYRFSLKTYPIDAFSDMCEYQQTSTESTFTRKTICSIAGSHGRKTISNNRFIDTVADSKTEREIYSEEEYRSLLENHFQIYLSDDPNISKLLVNHH